MEAYDRALHAPGFSSGKQWQAALHSSGAERQRILNHCRTIIQHYDIVELATQIAEQVRRLDVPLHGLWAVRSSATNEDGAHASFAGAYRTGLGILQEEIGSSVKDLWLLVWDERVLNYHAISRVGRGASRHGRRNPAAVRSASRRCAYSVHPLTGRAAQVMINAAAGLAATLVDRSATPNQYVVEIAGNSQPVRIDQRTNNHRADAGLTDDRPRSSNYPVVG